MRVTVLLMFMIGLTLGQDDEWNYLDGPLGPPNWPSLFPDDCAGVSQSPVSIRRYLALRDSSLGRFRFRNYDRAEAGLTLFNSEGHFAEVLVDRLDASISGGGLPGTFKADQFHFHWGSVGTQGSEHTLDGQRFPMEMHIVHYDTKFGSIETAAGEPEGIAVLGFFFEWSPVDNPALEPIVSQLVNIRAPDATTTINQVLSIGSLLPFDLREFFRYKGSFTTPRCNEVAIWTVFGSTIKVSPRQLEEFRKLETAPGIPLVDNFRPLQALNKRIITGSLSRRRSGSPTLLYRTLLTSWMPLIFASVTLYSVLT